MHPSQPTGVPDDRSSPFFFFFFFFFFFPWWGGAELFGDGGRVALSLGETDRITLRLVYIIPQYSVLGYGLLKVNVLSTM